MKTMDSNILVNQNTSKGERTWDIYSMLLDQRIIFLDTEVDANSASLIVGELLYLDSVKPGEDISLYIMSPGGSISAGLAIVDTMNYIKSDVRTICLGMAASMGAVILASGAKGKRFTLPNAEVMIHQPLISGGLSGQETDISIHANHLTGRRAVLNSLLSKATGKDIDTILKDTERDNYLSAEEAKEYGLVDHIVTNVNEAK